MFANKFSNYYIFKEISLFEIIGFALYLVAIKVE